MRNQFYRYKVVIPILFISIIYNLLWFSLFIYLLLTFPLFKISITLLFLLFYIMLAQPVKDFFIHTIFFKPLYPETQNTIIKDRRIRALSKKNHINRLLKLLLKELNLKAISIITKDDPFEQTDFKKDSDEAIQRINTVEFEIITSYFESSLQENVQHFFPEEIIKIRENYGWKTLIPITFKLNYFGFIALQNILDGKKKFLLEGLAARIGLILENEILSESALKNRTFKKEFTTARQIEKFLVEKNIIISQNYKVFLKKNENLLTDFPVLFESSLPGITLSGEFFIYCRISKSNKRMRTMMLFIISGYFLCHSQKSKNLNDLHKLLNQSINSNGREFGIEGFLIHHVSRDTWKVCYFGDNINAKAENIELPLKVVPPLGNNLSDKFECVTLKNKQEIILNLNASTEVMILKNEK